MSNVTESSEKGPDRASPWERIWGLLAIVFVVAAILMMVYGQWSKSRQIGSMAMQRVLPELQVVPHVQLEPGALKDWNILLISLDTTRANHLNCYGFPYTKTPVLNDLARHGVLCSQAITPSPATMPAHSSIMTGLYPLHHGVRANGTFTLADENHTLAETLQEEGYRTGAAISAFVLDSQFGIDQGFETFNDDLTVGMKYSPHMFRERAAELTNVPVTKWLREHGREKFFFWVHYFDPHAPYAAPEPYRTEYAQRPYDGEIEYADEQIGKMLSVLDEIGVRDRTLVIMVADHGEGLGQHGEQTHSLLVYDSTLHVPMIFSAPAPFPQSKVIESQVCLTDVMPTVLDLLGLPVPEGLDGVSLLQDVREVRPAIVIETLATMTLHGWAPLIGVRRADCKFILAPEKELYDLRRDPSEETNTHEDDPELANELYQQLAHLAGANDPYLATIVQQDLSMDEETRRRLESLGYIASSKAEDKPLEEMPDPKVMVYEWERVEQGIHLKLVGRVEEAVEILEDVLKKAPRDVYTRQNLSGCFSMMGDHEKALETIEQALEYFPQDSHLRLTKAALLISRNRVKEAEEIYRQVQEEEPENSEVLMAQARIAYLRGNPDEAIEGFEEIIESNPGSSGPTAYNMIGMIHLRAGRLDEARKAYEAALEIDGLNGEAHDGLANVFIAQEEFDEAMEHLQLALRFNPVQLDAMSTLGSLYRDKEQLSLGEAWCQHALSINPKYPAALNNLGLIRRDQEKPDEAEELFQQAIEAAPRLAAPRLNLAQLLLEKGDEQAAGAQFWAAVRADRNDVHALANFATFAYRQGQLADAAYWFQRAARLKPDYAMVHKYLGLIYATVDRPRASVRHLEQALELEPEDPETDQMRQVVAKMQEKIAEDPDAQEAPYPPPVRVRRRAVARPIQPTETESSEEPSPEEATP